MKSMNDLFLHFLQDIYYAERQGLKALAKVGKHVEDEDLKDFVQEQRDQSERHVESLEQVFETMGKRPRAKTCAAMNGLIEEVNEAISEGEKGSVLDAALIAGMQAMKHYEIARLGALKAWAKEMGNDKAAEVLSGLVEEDREADEDLSDIAEERTNPEASEHGDDESEDDEDDDEEEEEEEDDGDEDDDEENDEEEEDGDEAAEPAKVTRSMPSRSRKMAKA